MKKIHINLLSESFKDIDRHKDSLQPGSGDLCADYEPNSEGSTGYLTRYDDL